jgi:phosphate uptake regulator
MFREFIDALRKRPLLTQMFDEMEQMLDSGVEMYRMISAVLTGKEKLTEETHDRVYEIDRGINHLQRKIRKQLVQHLIVSPGTDVPISLVLMSIIKDAERVGDITKNLLEVAEAQGGAFREGKYDRRFRELLVETESLF